MKKKVLRGTATYWLVVSKNWLENEPMRRVFRTMKEAAHFIDHRTEGWDGWRLLHASAFAEYKP